MADTGGKLLTNLAAAPIESLRRVKLSANWMAAAGAPGQDAALYDAVRAVGLELCPALGITIPVGKDSLSMQTAWDDGKKRVVSPVSLIVSAFCRVEDVRGTWTPEVGASDQATALLLVDLGRGKNRLGLSALAQVTGQVGEAVPDVDSPADLTAFVEVLQLLRERSLIRAYHDRSDGGLLVAALEMAFAGKADMTLMLDGLVGSSEGVVPALFAEELGALIEVDASNAEAARGVFAERGLAVSVVGTVQPRAPGSAPRFSVRHGGEECFGESLAALRAEWSKTTHAMQRRRDNPACADVEHADRLDAAAPGIVPHLTFDREESVARALVTASTERPRVAILREQGVNGQVEMAAAFDRAGFRSEDVHMSDVLGGRVSLERYSGLVLCGGFSYGDVLGAGQGWAKSALLHSVAREELVRFFRRESTFTLGVCNGCQALSGLREIIPGAAHFPRFLQNESEQFEARFGQVQIEASPSVLLCGMAGSRLPVAIAHGEGRAVFDSPSSGRQAHVALRFVDGAGKLASYPHNPNGSAGGVTGLTSDDGRVTLMMPHPERVYRTLQHSYCPPEWRTGSDRGPWLRMFENARVFVG